MNVDTLFYVSVYSLTALAGLMLATGEGVPFPSGVTILLSVLAFFFNERHRVLRVNLIWSNILGLSALTVAAAEFFGENIEARLLSGAHFLVYLTWIVLFQEKRLRQYWWLMALGLLQVAVGSVLTTSGWYGVLLLGYLLLALWTMSVFNLFSGATAFHALPERHAEDAGPAQPHVSGSSGLSLLGGVFSLKRRSEVRDVIQQDVPGKWVSARFVSGVLGVAVSGLGLGLVLFLFVPRFWIGSGNPFARRGESAGRTLTGFSGEVRLGHLGRILESNERVMQVRLYDRDTTPETPVRLEDFAAMYGLEEPLFRGSVLDTYDKGRWASQQGRTSQGAVQSDKQPGLIRQEYRLEASVAGTLFTMRPILRAQMDPYETLTIDRDTGILTSRSEARDSLEYYVYSPKLGSHPNAVTRERPFMDLPVPSAYSGSPMQRAIRAKNTKKMPSWNLSRYLALPETGLERLSLLAREITDPERLPPGDKESPEMKKAKVLEAHLRDSGRFTYSLNMTVVDPQADPVEDFLFNRHSGHCEYYASALALMLRAAEVPSRLVTGFKGAEYFRSGNYYEVAQRHAHAWVEAYVDGDWIVLDATPQARDDSVRNFASQAGFWSNARTSLSSMWATYVVSMSFSRQKESLYDPLQGSMSGGLGSVRQAIRGVQSAITWFKDLLASPEQTAGGGGIAILVTLLAVVVLVVQVVLRMRGGATSSGSDGAAKGWRRFLPAWLSRLWSAPSGEGVVIAFYERFLRLVAQRGLQPGQGQTAREFAGQVERLLVPGLRLSAANGLPQELTELYYRVRFGGSPLAEGEQADIDQRLSALETALDEPAIGRGRPLAKSSPGGT